MWSPRQLKIKYENGHNIMALCWDKNEITNNIREAIEISYDLQTGSYIAAMNDKKMAAHKDSNPRYGPEAFKTAGLGQVVS
jgi:hypothetical protein